MSLLGLVQPIHRDEGVFWTIGSKILEGQLPYLDLFDHKPPGIHYLAAGLFALFGEYWFVPRLFILLINFASAALLYTIGKKDLGQNSAITIAAIYLTLSPWYQGSFFLTEVVINFFFLIVFYCLLHQPFTHRHLNYLLAGLAFGTGLLFKPTILLSGLALLIGLSLVKERRLHLWLTTGLTFFTGVILGVFPALWLLINKNLLNLFFNQVIVFNLYSYPPYPLTETLSQFPKILVPGLPWWLLGFFGILIIKDSSTLFKLIRLQLLFIIPLIFLRPYHHYWLQLLPWVLFMAAYLIKKVKLSLKPMLLFQIALSLAFLIFSLNESLPELKSELGRAQNLACNQVIEPEDYFLSDCNPEKYFYQVDQPFTN